MRNIKAIFKKELYSFFTSPMAYIFLVVFSLVNGYFFTNTFFLYDQSNMRSLFSIVPLVYLFFIPAVSMGLLSREKGLGTIEILSTLPIHDYELVIGKYLCNSHTGIVITDTFGYTSKKIKCPYMSFKK